MPAVPLTLYAIADELIVYVYNSLVRRRAYAGCGSRGGPGPRDGSVSHAGH